MATVVASRPTVVARPQIAGGSQNETPVRRVGVVPQPTALTLGESAQFNTSAWAAPPPAASPTPPAPSNAGHMGIAGITSPGFSTVSPAPSTAWRTGAASGTQYVQAGAVENSERRLPWPSARAVPPDERAAWFEDPVYQRYLDELTKSEAFSGNRVRVLLDGAESFAQKEAAIADADAVFLKMYQFDNDDAGRRIASQLEHAAQRGAKVYVQYGIKSFYNFWQMALIKLQLKDPVPPVLCQLAQQRNAILVPNDRPTHWGNLILERDHEKYLITHKTGEAVKLIMGGMNISDAWMNGGTPGAQSADGVLYRDTDVEIVGPTAKDAIHAFIADMGCYDAETLYPIVKTYGDINNTSQHQLYPSSADNAVVRFLRNKPSHGEAGQYIKKLYISLFQNVPAGEHIRIENAYFLPVGDLQHAIIEAANRGVIVEIVTNTPDCPEWEGSMVSTAAHSLFRKMLRKSTSPENLHFYEFVGSPLTGHNAMHQKVASFGDKGPTIWASSNLDNQSLNFNRECAALVYGAQARRAFDAMWEMDVNGTRQDSLGAPIYTVRRLSPEALQFEESKWTRFKQRSLRVFSWLL